MSLKDVLNIGSVVYEFYKSKPRSRFVIDRGTNKYAFVKSIKLKRHYYEDGKVYKTGERGDCLVTSQYYVETESIKNQFENALQRQELLSKLDEVKFKKLSNDKLKNILEVVNE